MVCIGQNSSARDGWGDLGCLKEKSVLPKGYVESGGLSTQLYIFDDDYRSAGKHSVWIFKVGSEAVGLISQGKMHARSSEHAGTSITTIGYCKAVGSADCRCKRD